jgi:hypothetical protein
MTGEPAGRLALDAAAARGDAMAGAAMAALGETVPAAVTRFGAVFRGRAVVVRRTVFFAAGFAAFVVRAGGRFAAATLPAGFLALVGCLTDRAATAALPAFLSILATRLSWRPAFPAPASCFALAAPLAAAGFDVASFDFAGFAGRLAAAARLDDFDALLFLETARAIEPSPGEPRRRRLATTATAIMLLVDDEEEEEEDDDDGRRAPIRSVSTTRGTWKRQMPRHLRQRAPRREAGGRLAEAGRTAGDEDSAGHGKLFAEAHRYGHRPSMRQSAQGQDGACNSRPSVRFRRIIDAWRAIRATLQGPSTRKRERGGAFDLTTSQVTTLANAISAFRSFTVRIA